MSSVFDSVDPPQPSLIDACVHCGFCLLSCPTYLLWGEEMDSPRGRIYLMKAALEGRAAMTPSFVAHFDNCLGCMACVTACPSGVQYGPLIERTRAQIERRYRRPVADRLFRSLLFALLPYPARLRVALAVLAMSGWLLRAVEGMGLLRLLPRRLQAAVALAPRISLSSLGAQTPSYTPASGELRLRAGLLTGCVQRLAFSHVNRATVNVLAAEGCSVSAPPAQGCCGALPLHAGNFEQARALARRTIEEFERAGVDRVVANAAGCGSCLKEYGALFADDPEWSARAGRFSERVRDISEVLVELGEPRARRHPIHARVAYHDACHLSHAQGVYTQPRQLLASIPGLEVTSPAEADICCGSAGIYNLVEPDAAGALGDRKATHLAALAPDIIATANPGCMLQIAAAGRRAGRHWPIVHPVELLDASIRGVDVRRT
ncbi:MAG: glycolate oxidase [Acidobacteria bacterium RIFCSPLOWO2_12_FULL_67_14]|nr:MAG: glycolate oxidase [Acidobacteria bacterium RIFCSPLOWO2_12_FULL_67_14]